MHQNLRGTHLTVEKPIKSRFVFPSTQMNVVNPVSKNAESSLLPMGLKNVGNTCFLNSIIQFLFGADNLRTALIKSYGKQTNMDTTRFSKLIGKLFAYLEEKSSEKDRIKDILQRMVKQLQTMNIQYRRHLQEDALQTLLNILNDIQRFHPPLIKDFDIQYRVACSCWTNTVLEKTLSYSLTTCMKCKEKIQKTFISSPTYIIYTNFNKEKVLPERTEKGQCGSEKLELKYKLKSQIIYYGNGYSGHYIARRQQKNQSFYIDDENVLTVNQTNQKLYEGNKNSGMILLYQLKDKCKIPDKKINLQQNNGLSLFIESKASTFVKKVEPKNEPLKFQQKIRTQQRFNKDINTNSDVARTYQKRFEQSKKIPQSIRKKF